MGLIELEVKAVSVRVFSEHCEGVLEYLQGGTSEAPSGDNPETAPAPTPLPLEELAPAPSNDDLFGES